MSNASKIKMPVDYSVNRIRSGLEIVFDHLDRLRGSTLTLKDLEPLEELAQDHRLARQVVDHLKTRVRPLAHQPSGEDHSNV
jgi:hypothetical protein